MDTVFFTDHWKFGLFVGDWPETVKVKSRLWTIAAFVYRNLLFEQIKLLGFFYWGCQFHQCVIGLGRNDVERGVFKAVKTAIGLFGIVLILRQGAHARRKRALAPFILVKPPSGPFVRSCFRLRERGYGAYTFVHAHTLPIESGGNRFHKWRKWGIVGAETAGYKGGMDINFIKMHGLGNDFVIVDARDQRIDLSKEKLRQVSDRNRGVGCDQFIVIEPSAQATAFMRIYNPDGSEAGACGNATRCVADILMREGDAGECALETVSGILECFRQGDLVRVNMGAPRLSWNQIPVKEQCDTLHLPLEGDPVGVSMGNPHCVFFCANAELEPVDKLGSKIERDAFFPDRANVEFVSVLAPDMLRMRVWERGAGITQACGSGACAAGVAAIRRGLTGPKVLVRLDGGDLTIEWGGEGQPVFMTGPVAYVFEGTISI